MPTHARSHIATSFIALSMLVAAPVMAADDGQGLNLSTSLRSKMFWKLNVVSTKTKTKSEQPRDLKPEIVSIAELTAMRNEKAADLYKRLTDPVSGTLTGVTSDQFFQAMNSSVGLNNIAIGGAGDLGLNRNTIISIRNALQTTQDLTDFVKVRYYGTPTSLGLTAVNLLDGALIKPDEGYGFESGKGYLTTPQGIRAKSGNPSDTVALSVGYFLNDDQNWAVEALLLGAPLRASVYGAGTNDRGEPNQLVGQEIIRTKMLPPIVKFGYYFGNKSWAVRPYAGVAAMYAIFFDSKTSSYFDQYQGGKTSVSIKNSFGVGPFIGLESDIAKSGWQVGLSIGKIKIKTDATLSTRGTMFRTGDMVFKDYKSTLSDAIQNAEITTDPDSGVTTGLLKTADGMADKVGVLTGLDVAKIAPAGMTTELMKDLATYKRGDGTLGTYVRKQRNTLDNTIFMLSIGKSF